MRTLSLLLNGLLYLVGLRKPILSAYIQNNYTVYVKDKDLYYNLKPLISNQIVFYKTELDTYEQCEILNPLKDNTFYVEIERFGTVSRFVAKGDKLYPHVPETKVKGYINGLYFIVTDDGVNRTPEPKKVPMKLNTTMLSAMF